MYPELEPTPLQLEEDLEQLKVLEHGYKMKVRTVHLLSYLPSFPMLEIRILERSRTQLSTRTMDYRKRNCVFTCGNWHFVWQVIKVDHEAHGVDVPEDVEKIESYMKERNLS